MIETWKYWINPSGNPMGGFYYHFQNFKVYWAYRQEEKERISKLPATGPVMIPGHKGYEQYFHILSVNEIIFSRQGEGVYFGKVLTHDKKVKMGGACSDYYSIHKTATKEYIRKINNEIYLVNYKTDSGYNPEQELSRTKIENPVFIEYDFEVSWETKPHTSKVVQKIIDLKEIPFPKIAI